MPDPESNLVNTPQDPDPVNSARVFPRRGYMSLLLLIFIIFIALVFDYTNGMHDAANSISTIVSTRVWSPRQAVIWAAFFNFTAILLFHTTVAETIGKGMIDIKTVTPTVILAGSG